MVCAAEVPHALDADTVIVPPLAPDVTLIVFVVEDPVQPPGNVQLYDVAFATGVMLYIFTEFAHTLALPAITPGVPGIGETVTDMIWAADVPHAFPATTEMFPLLAPTMALIEFVDDAPVQPPGKVQV